MRFSANLGFLWKELPLPEAIGRAAASGFGAVECHQPFAWPAATVAEALKTANVDILSLNASLGGPGDFGLMAVAGREADARSDVDEAVDYASTVGCRFVSVFAGLSGCGPETEAVFRSNLAYAGEAAASAGIAIVLEPLSTAPEGYHLTRVVDAVRTIEAIGADNIFVMADTFHTMTTEGSLDVISEHLDKIGHIQISGWPDRSEPDHGIDFDRWLPELVAAGYDGVFGAEYHPRTTVEAGLGWFDEWNERSAK